jgi:hypothetical protein
MERIRHFVFNTTSRGLKNSFLFVILIEVRSIDAREKKAILIIVLQEQVYLQPNLQVTMVTNDLQFRLNNHRN